MAPPESDTNQSIETSAYIEEALVREYEELSARAVQHRERAELLQKLAEEAEQQANTDEQLLEELAGALGTACQLRIEQLDRRLRGRRLQEIAVEILISRLQPGETIHYKQWFSWVEEAGFKVGGKDPLATFLGQIGRSPQIAPVGRRSGLYSVAKSPED